MLLASAPFELRFHKISILEQKEYVPDDFIYLFQESDRTFVQRTNTSEGEEEFEVGYFAERAVILHRLDLAGYTAERARQSFELWLDEQRESYIEYAAHRLRW
jgi:hypothetical protein